MNRSLKLSLTISLLCFTGFICHSQNQIQKDDFSIAIRGKVFAFFILEDTYFRTATIGTEIIYKDRHSLGIDLSYWRWRFQEDDPDPIELYDQFEARTFLYIDYKLKFLDMRQTLLYVNLYSKLGLYNMWYEEYENDSSTINLDFINSTTTGNFSEFGLGIGIKHFFNNTDRWGIDFSVNAATRFEINDKIIYETGYYQELANVKEQSYLPYLKLNFFYILTNPKSRTNNQPDLN